MLILLGLTVVLLILALIHDIRFSRIPNWLTLPAIVVAVILHISMDGLYGLRMSLGGMAVGFCLFIGFYLLGGMGAGDVKLMAAVGALLGPQDAFYSVVFTALAGGLYSVVLIIIYDFNKATLRRWGQRVRVFLATGRFSHVPMEEKRPSLRYGVAIAAGTFFVLLRRFA